MAHRRYHQYSGIASAMSVLRGRWTLLIVYKLLSGPHRFKDITDELPGISTNLLSQRLKSLEHFGVLRRRTLSRQAKVAVYELTPKGQALEPTLLELGKWSRQFVGSCSAEVGESSG